MNLLPVAALTALLVAGAFGCLVVAVRPRRRSLSEVRAVLLGVPTVSGTSATSVRSDGERAASPTWVALSTRLAAGAAGDQVRTRLGAGLLLIERTAVDVVSQILVGTVLGTFTVSLCIASLMGVGAITPSPWWAAAVLCVAPMCCTVMWSDVTGRVERRRRELRRAVNDFVQLTAVGLTTDQSIEEAIAFALSVGESDMFDLLRDELQTAPARGVPQWEALDALGQLHGERELSELASSIERQGTQGVSITDTVATLATSMRAKALDELERDADRANANLAGPTVGFVVATIVFLAYPLAIRISGAFGG